MLGKWDGDLTDAIRKMLTLLEIQDVHKVEGVKS